MNILVPAALAFGAIIPVILILYLMRPKRQERVVGSTLIWQQALQDLQASRPWQRLHITPLLLLQLLAALVIVIVLVRPAIFTSSPISGNTIIILQASASMQATDVAPSRFENAKSSVSDMIDSLGSGDHISLISMAHTPQILATDTQDKTILHNALQRASVTNQDADLGEALSLASSLAAGETNPQVLVVGDGHVSDTNGVMIAPFPVRYMPIGTDAPNVALMALSSRSIQGQLIAFAQVVNFSHQQRAIPVELYADSKLIGVKTVTLGAGASGAVQWNGVPATSRFLNAHLLSQDAMSADHEAYAIVGSSIHAKVLLVTKANRFLETALRLQSNVDLYELAPDKYSSSVLYDLTIFDGFVPASLPQGNLLFLNPPTGSYLFGTAGQPVQISHINAGNDTINMLTDVDLSSVHVIHTSHPLQPALWEQTIINAPETPLLIAGEHNNQRIAVIGFDLHDSDLPLQPAFPVLMNNMANWLLPPPVGGDGQVAPGQPITVQTWPGAERVTITAPDAQATTVGPPFPALAYDKTNAVGVYRVTQQVHARQLQGAFTVNLFNANQSNLAPAKALPVLHSTNIAANGNTVARQLREIWPWVAAFLLLVLCAEWWLFSRNYRPQVAIASRQTAGGGKWNKGAKGRRFVTSNRLLNALQDQWQERYITVKKRTQKATKRLKAKLRKQSKGAKRVNI